MSEKKKNIIIVILVALVIILVATIACLSIIIRNKDNIVSSNKQNVEDLVSTAYYKVIVDNEYNSEYKYDVPKINLKSDNINAINNEIYKKYVTDIIEPLEKDAQEGLGITCIAIDYKYYINFNILSLVIRWQSHAAGAESFSVYNININTGETVSNKEIIAKKKLTENQYLKELKENYKKACETYNKASLQPNNQYYESVLEYTLADENCNINVPMFLDEDGNINVIAYIGSVSGASGYEHILNTRNVK